MHKSITISEEEYADSIRQLEEINKNKEKIFVVYNKYCSNDEKLSNDKIMNLVLLLTRRNQALSEKINFEKKKYLNQLINPSVLFVKMVHSWIAGDESTMPFLRQEKSFHDFEKKIRNLRNEMASNNVLLKEISDILTNEEILLRKKKIYERLANKKDVKQKKKRLPFRKNNVTMK